MNAYRTVLIGAGRVAAGYAHDPLNVASVRYATHAQVLASHPRFAWGAVVDRSGDAAASVARQYSVPLSSTNVAEIIEPLDPEVAVLAIPPSGRYEILAALPNIRAVIVEKPLGATIDEARQFLQACSDRRILVQVNLWRRADPVFRSLSAGLLREQIGSVQAIVCMYGNGLRNNAIHMVDAVRMLVGEFQSVQSVGPSRTPQPGMAVRPAEEDRDVFFAAIVDEDITASFHPLAFAHYRENGLDIWGTDGRLSILVEGLVVQSYARRESRMLTAEFEVSADRPIVQPSVEGQAFYELYSNLAAALDTTEELCCSGEEALRSTLVIDAVERSLSSGKSVSCRP